MTPEQQATLSEIVAPVRDAFRVILNEKKFDSQLLAGVPGVAKTSAPQILVGDIHAGKSKAFEEVARKLQESSAKTMPIDVSNLGVTTSADFRRWQQEKEKRVADEIEERARQALANKARQFVDGIDNPITVKIVSKIRL